MSGGKFVVRRCRVGEGELFSFLGEDRDRGSLRPLGSLYDIELDILALDESVVAFHLDRGVVDKNIRPTGARKEPEPFRIVELCHLTNMLRHAPIIRRRILGNVFASQDPEAKCCPVRSVGRIKRRVQLRQRLAVQDIGYGHSAIGFRDRNEAWRVPGITWHDGDKPQRPQDDGNPSRHPPRVPR